MIVFIRDDNSEDNSISEIDNHDDEDVCKLLCIISNFVLDLYLINTSFLYINIPIQCC